MYEFRDGYDGEHSKKNHGLSEAVGLNEMLQ